VTFSIVACDLEKSDWGVAVASKFPAVGSAVPHARAGAGAIATQAWANVAYGPEGLALLAEGRSASEVVRALTEADGGRDPRQVGIVDARGLASTFTGEKCMKWAGGLAGEGFACQGNILTGPEVVEEMARAYRAAEGDLVDGLLAALAAGDTAGGDRRGKQSAAILIVRPEGGYDKRSDRYVDLRVDDHAEPVRELLRIFQVFDREYLIRNDPLLPVTAALAAELRRRLGTTGHLKAQVSQAADGFDGATRKALEAFAGENNLEGKIRDDDQVYESLVRELRDVTPEVPPVTTS
jgi:uncharacterized Ntn-hydrolase superfamily protein